MPKIFDLVIESLGNKLRNNPRIKGTIIAGINDIGAQYAYDLWLLVEAKGDCIEAIMEEMENFWLFSGLKINKDKTSVIKIGNWPDLTQTLRAASPFSWTNGPIKISGVLIHADPDIIAEINYSILLQNVHDKTMMWRYRTPTPYGKIQVIDMLVASLYAYMFSSLPSPSENIIKKI